MVVSAPGEDGAGTGVNGDQGNNSADDAGAVYVFVRTGTTWSQQAYLKASNAEASGEFGTSTALAGDTLVVGAGLEDSRSRVVNGNQQDNGADEAGAAYVFVRSGVTWGQQAYLKASNADSNDGFGVAVAAAGDTVVIGAPGEESSAMGVNGDQGNDASLAGAAYVFVRTGTTWSQQAYLKASNTATFNLFGNSVGIAGDRLVVGSAGERSGATDVNGDQGDSGEAFAGAAYAFVRHGTTWSQESYFKASNTDAGDFFGNSVAIATDTVLVGAPFEASSDTRVIGNQYDNSINGAGAAYLFGPRVDTDQDGLPDDWETAFGLDPTSSTGDNGRSGDLDGDGLTNVQQLAVGTHPRGFFTRYLAEGATSSFFDTRLALLNPGSTGATATLSYRRVGAATVAVRVPLPAATRVTVDPNRRFGAATTEFSTKLESDQPFVVDRTMSWGTDAYGAHAETAVAAPSPIWYLAEGATHSGFNLFYLLLNPNAAEAQVRVRYLRPSGVSLEKIYTLPADSRTNIWVDVEEFGGQRLLASTDVSAVFEVLNDQPIIVERAMYLDLPGEMFGAGHESAGVTAPATQWFLAEGATGPFFDLFVLIANPGASDALIEATYLLPDGSTITKPYTVAANSRFNIWVDYEDARLANTALSTTIRAINSVPVVVERAMWWPGNNWYEAHNSPGSTVTGTKWALAEGEVGGARGVDTYILLANTSPTTGTVNVTVLLENGTSAERTFPVPANSRFNVDVRTEFPSTVDKRFGAIVESVGLAPAQIVVERAMYWDALGQRWAAGTNALATKLQ